MSKIKKLSQEVVTHIAAGQVIQRPASVVKELVENALDAEAKTIRIELVDGGMTSISVIDDGIGMSQEDIELSIEPHATSKIKDINDIMTIQSFGFRGEALASIASSADVIIESRRRESDDTDSPGGYRISVKKGTLNETKPVGMPEGTRVIVEKLFSSIPARKKKLQNVQAELRECIRTVQSLAAAVPDVSFQLFHNNKELMHIPQRTNDRDIIELLYKKDVKKWLPVEYKADGYRITGHIGLPQIAKSHDRHQHIIVNRRPIMNSDIKKAVKKGFGTLLQKGDHPVFLIHISVPQERIDINVDPKKERIGFLSRGKSDTLFQHIQKAVDNMLSKAHLVYGDGYDYKDMDPDLADAVRDSVMPWQVRDIDNMNLMQVHNLYIIAEDDKGLVMIDQHAAHERILFEQFKNAYETMDIAVHELEKPVVLELTAEEMSLAEEHIDELAAGGFMYSEFGGETLKLETIPAMWKERNVEELFKEVLNDVREGSIKNTDRAYKTLAYVACRTAVKAGDALTQKEMKNLFKKLLSCERPYTCPHGRPTIISLSKGKLDRMFKR